MLNIRHGVFETNSSSVHSLTVCTQSEMQQWKNGKMVYDMYREKLVSATVVTAEDPERYFDIQAFSDYVDRHCFEEFEEECEMSNGETIIVFGYHGYDG